MSKPIKIFELSGEKFSKGLSHVEDFPVNGLFVNNGTPFNPFDDYGYFNPSLDAVVTDNTKTYTPTVLTSVNISGDPYIYCHTPTKLFQVEGGSPYTTTDVTAQISVTNPVGGAGVFKNKYIYVDVLASTVYANAIPVANASNVAILSVANTTEHYRPMCIAPDKNLFIADGAGIDRITSVTGTTGNTKGYYELESGMVVRDLINDGRYLVAIADNNQSQKIGQDGLTGNYRCQVLFYDVNNGRPTADYIYEFTDSYLVSVKLLDGIVHIFGKDYLWVCNSQTAPKKIYSFIGRATITEPPKNPFQVTVIGSSIHWVAGSNNSYAYGSFLDGMKKILYSPYYTSSNQSCILGSGNLVYMGNDGNNQMLQVLNTGSTRSEASLKTVPIFLKQPFKFAFIKVIMKSKLNSGASISVAMSSNTDTTNIQPYTTKNYSQIGAKQTIIFDKTNDGGNPSVQSFTDFNLTVNSNRAVALVEVWAYPLENYEQFT